jgi:hypothetical protein
MGVQEKLYACGTVRHSYLTMRNKQTATLARTSRQASRLGESRSRNQVIRVDVAIVVLEPIKAMGVVEKKALDIDLIALTLE